MTAKHKIIDFLAKQDWPRKQLWINEALFGFDYVQKHCEALPKGAHVLEIGSGSGILLSMLSDKNTDVKFEGVEPFGDGFSSLEGLTEYVSSLGVNISMTHYENFEPKQKYDLIFCINVFEHLSDWRDFLETAQQWLNADGVCVLLCPNYGFPYESHFKVPIFINKKITYSIFKNHVEGFEKQHDVEGLWKSLNFVKKSEVKSYLKTHQGLELQDRKDILEQMVARLLTDKEFLKRQKLIGMVALMLSKLKLLKLFNLIPNFIPYMHLELTKQK